MNQENSQDAEGARSALKIGPPPSLSDIRIGAHFQTLRPCRQSVLLPDCKGARAGIGRADEDTYWTTPKFSVVNMKTASKRKRSMEVRHSCGRQSEF